MPRVPLPQVGMQTGAAPMYDAPGFVPLVDIAGRQVSNLGQGMSQFGTGVADAARVMQDQINDSRATEGFTKWSETASNALSGENGYLRTLGKAAQDRKDATLTSIEKSAEEIQNSLQNDVQRGMFKEAVRRHMMGVRERVYGHEAEQVRIDYIGQSEALRVQSIKNAAEAEVDRSLTPNAVISAAAAESLDRGRSPTFGQPVSPVPLPGATTVQEPQQGGVPTSTLHLNTALEAANQSATAQGWGPDDPRRQALVLKTTTDYHAIVADTYLQRGRTKEASDYISKLTSKDVDPIELEKMRGIVRRATDADSATRMAISIVDQIDQQLMPQLAKERGNAVSKYEVFGADALRLTQAAIDAEYQKPGSTMTREQRSLAHEEVRLTFARRKEQWSERSVEFLDQAEKLLTDNPNLTINSTAFPARLYEGLKKYGKLTDAEKFQGGLGKVTTDEAYAQVVAAVDSGELRGMSLTALKDRFYASLSPKTWEELKQYHAGANEAARVKHRSMFSEGEMMKNLAAVGGVINDPFKGPKGATEQLRYARFLQEIQKRINQDEADGKTVTDDRIREFADELFMERGTVPTWGGLFTESKFLWEMTPEEEDVAYSTDFETVNRIARAGEPDMQKAIDAFKNRSWNLPSTTKLTWFASEMTANRLTQNMLERAFRAAEAENLPKTPETLVEILLPELGPKRRAAERAAAVEKIGSTVEAFSKSGQF